MSGEFDAILQAISTLVEGRGATTRSVRAQPALTTLPVVVARASKYGTAEPTQDVVAGVAVNLLVDASDALEAFPNRAAPNRALAARLALALEPGTQDRPFRGRRNAPGRLPAVADALGYETDSLTRARGGAGSPLRRLLVNLTDEVLRIDIAYELGELQHARRFARDPLDSAINCDWLRRFEKYYAIWTPLSGLANDIGLAQARLRRGDAVLAEGSEHMSLYFYARYVWQLERFIESTGGLWITPDREAEQRLADIVWHLSDEGPFDQIEESHLRLAYAQAPEPATFKGLVETDQTLQAICRSWHSAISACVVVAEDCPTKGCTVHALIARARAFMAIVDDEWDGLADWYLRPRPESTVEAVMNARTSGVDR